MITNDEKIKIRELRGRNYSYAKIAKALNISLSTVFRHGSSDDEDLICPHCGELIFNGKILLNEAKRKSFNLIWLNKDFQRFKNQKDEIDRLT